MLSKNLESALNESLREAQMRNHSYLTVEHLLYAITNTAEGKDIIENVNGNIKNLQTDLLEYLEDLETDPKQSGEPIQTYSFQKILENTLLKVHSAEKKEVEIGDVIAEFLVEDDSQARYFLEKQGILRIDVLNYISHGMDDDSYFENNGFKLFNDFDEDDEHLEEEEVPKDVMERRALANYAVNMTELALNGKYDVLVGREKELQRTIEILARRTKNNPLHVGEPGVGKTAIAQGLADRIAKGEVPDRLHGFSVYSLEMGSLLAGTRFRGDFEQRMKNIFNAFAKIGKVIVFIDEIHTIVGAGQVQGSAMDAANMLKPLLTNGDMRVIGSTTYEEFRKYFEKDRALSRRFQKIDVKEPTVQDTVKILNGLKNKYEEYHKIEYTASAIRAAVELSARFIKDRFLPDKAIDVIDEAGANISLYRPNKPRISAADIEKYVARIAGVPVGSLSQTGKNNLTKLNDELLKFVYGQNEAVQKISSSIRRHRAGLASETKPVGSFLLVGPTGVGKTELAKQLASILGIELIRFDMSEYMEAHSVSKLLGSPPGYVGFDQGAALTDSVRKHPQCVLLLDEIEKAHPDIMNTLLQIMDNARATDATGRACDFSNVLLLMTSNAGSREMSINRIGFSADGKLQKGDGKAALKNIFSPEFINRLDATIYFKPLDKATIIKIVDKFLYELNTQLNRQRITVEVTDAVKKYLADTGFNAEYGARPMTRVIQEKLKDPITNLILDGKLKKGNSVIAGLDGNTVQLKVKKSTSKNPDKSAQRKVKAV